MDALPTPRRTDGVGPKQEWGGRRRLGQCRSLAAQCLIVVDQYSSGNSRVVTDRSASVMIQMRSPSAVL